MATRGILEACGLILLAGGASAGQPSASSPGFRFVDVSERLEVGEFVAPAGMAYGLSAADYDDDGDVDLFVPTERGFFHLLFRNRGDGTFDEVGAASGITWTGRARVGLFVDLTGDNLLDLVIGGDCFSIGDPDCPASDTVRVYVQEADHTFTDVTLACGIGEDIVFSEDEHRGTLNAGDLDGDGWLDLYTAHWAGSARLLLNDRAGGFIDASARSPIGERVESHHWQSVMFDADQDGDLDIFAAIDFAPNRLWINRGDASFEKWNDRHGVGVAFNDMGVSLGDFDNDLDLDIAVTEIESDILGKHGVLLRRDGRPGKPWFTEIGLEAGIGHHGWGWGASFGDFDLDGLLDLAVTNGMDVGEPFAEDRSRLYRNMGPGRARVFEDVGASVGFDDTLIAPGLAAFDMDRDGDLDLAQATFNGGVRLLENRRVGSVASRSWICVRPRMVGPNARAIGAEVYVLAGGVWRMRIITAGTSLLGQEPAEAHFGLGVADIVQEVRVRFPDGGESILRDVGVNQTIEVR